MEKRTCRVFDIQRFSVHDGPGIRTNIFLKGCLLRCRWCCNPESQSEKPELLFQPEKCIGCGSCTAVCPSAAAVELDGRITLLRDRCTGCGACVDGCYPEARSLKGEVLTVQEALEEALKDRAFYESSGGGVTLSGGEPLLHPEFAGTLLMQCKALGVNTAVETCGEAEWEAFERVLPYTDLFLYDVKHLDSEKHRRFTGRGNERIQENLLRLAKRSAAIILRVPVIPTFNMDLDALEGIVRLAERLGIARVNLLPYHRYAQGKYTLLGRRYWHPGVERADAEEVAALAARIRSESVSITIGG